MAPEAAPENAVCGASFQAAEVLHNRCRKERPSAQAGGLSLTGPLSPVSVSYQRTPKWRVSAKEMFADGTLATGHVTSMRYSSNDMPHLSGGAIVRASRCDLSPYPPSIATTRSIHPGLLDRNATLGASAISRITRLYAHIATILHYRKHQS